ncbi:MAG: hypothetical protein LBL65_04970 [Campylobacteraceae bacterium]|jgi:hypothetical protein|nr:hypothetical protein [Campylobacteraceae bacterium]
MRFVWKEKKGTSKYRLTFRDAKTNDIISLKEVIGQVEFNIPEELNQYGDDLLLRVEYFEDSIKKYIVWFPYFHPFYGIQKTKLKIKSSIDNDGFPLRLILKDINNNTLLDYVYLGETFYVPDNLIALERNTKYRFLKFDHKTKKWNWDVDNGGYKYLFLSHLSLKSTKPLEGKFVIAERRDGLGARLTAVFNAILISEVTGISFYVYWSKSGIGKEFHSVESVDSIFSKEFIKNHLLGEKVSEKFRLIPYCRENIKNIKDFWIESINQDNCIAGHGYLLDMPRMSGEEKHMWTKRVLNKLDFSEEIKLAIKEAYNIPLPRSVVAIHIRSGDVVYGKYETRITYSYKVICTPLVAYFVKKFQKEGKTTVLVGQESEFISEMAQQFGAIDASAFYLDGFSPAQKSLFDTILISRCEYIIAEMSSLPRLARMFSGVEVKSIFSLYSEQKLASIIESEIKEYGDNFHDMQKAYSFFLAHTYTCKNASFGKSDYLLSSALSFDSENPIYMFLKAANYYKHKKLSEAEDILIELFKSVDMRTFETFKNSPLIKLLSAPKSSHAPDTYILSIKYQAFEGESDKSLTYCAIMHNFFTNSNAEQRKIILHEALQNIAQQDKTE